MMMLTKFVYYNCSGDPMAKKCRFVVGLPDRLLNFFTLSQSKFIRKEKLVPGCNQKYSPPHEKKKQQHLPQKQWNINYAWNVGIFVSHQFCVYSWIKSISYLIQENANFCGLLELPQPVNEFNNFCGWQGPCGC